MTQEAIEIKGVSVKSLGIITTVLVAIFGGGGIATFQNLNDVATKEEVETAVEQKVKDATKDLPSSRDLPSSGEFNSLKRKVDSMGRVLKYQALMSEHQKNVLQHIAEKKKGPLPKESEELKSLRDKILFSNLED